MKTNRKIPSVTSILDKIEVLMIILAIAGIIYFTHSLFALIIGIAGLILFRYVNLFSQTSENDMRTGYEKKSGKIKAIMPVLKKIWVVMIPLSILCLAYVSKSFHRIPHFDRTQLEIEYSDVPEGTAYVDVLVKIDSSDENYTDFNVIPQKLISKGIDNEGSSVFNSEPIDINKNSEIAKYDDDGYKSLSLHSTYVKDFDVVKPYGYEHDDMMLKCSAEKLYKQYGKFRLAYVGKNGEVLGVTKKTSHTYDIDEPYKVIADGDKATYSTWGNSPLFYVAVYIIRITFYVTIIIIAVAIINHSAEKISWDSWVREQTRKDRDNNGESGRNL
ncbi:hypothetical protein Rumal_1232 [Ruminococcus albus 7 = DSM 20455]|uniref:Uncharacterized protein n=1 Tax=Ruminococcus albus (strain ATCC 27210 / DSM 20455 / JCM 14654 / NCDO 2250 / 7) TaxID=697329 RepID=E6UDW1_RUMA7|nr:hypothetical protein Rumal_1232 [Ruminococcus albus 7 = DSM 20455]